MMSYFCGSHLWNRLLEGKILEQKKDIFRSFSYFTFEEVILLKNVLTDKPLTPLGQKDFFKLRIKK